MANEALRGVPLSRIAVFPLLTLVLGGAAVLAVGGSVFPALALA